MNFLTKKNDKGFTLIELLVVIGIIGILASVILASLNTARKKARDARRVSDVKELQLALSMYYDSNNAYPTTIGTGTPLVPTYIQIIPSDPQTGTAYDYAVAASSSNYIMRTTLEEKNSALNSAITAPNGTFIGVFAVTGACANTNSPYYYCVQP